MSDIETGGAIENHYEGEKRVIINTITQQGALSTELRAALTKAVEDTFSRHMVERTAVRPQATAVEAKDLGVELRERLMAELVEVWNKDPEKDRHLEARIRELESRGWFVSPHQRGLPFAKHPDSEEGFILPAMPGYAKGTILKRFDVKDLTPNSPDERVVVRLIRPCVLDADHAKHLLDRVDWRNPQDVETYLFLISDNAEKGLVEVKAY